MNQLKTGTAVAIGVFGLVLGLSAPALGRGVSAVSHRISGSSIKPHSIAGNRLKPHTLSGAQVKPLVFHNLKLINGWQNGFTNRPASYAVDLQGVVHLRGALDGGTGVAFVLPSAVRPNTGIYLVDHTSSANAGDILVAHSGKVTPRASNNDQATFTDLDGITYTVN